MEYFGGVEVALVDSECFAPVALEYCYAFRVHGVDGFRESGRAWLSEDGDVVAMQDERGHHRADGFDVGFERVGAF